MQSNFGTADDPNAITPGMRLTVPNRCGAAGPPTGVPGVYDRGPRLHANGTVSGNVYLDRDADGVANDAAPNGIEGITVELFAASDLNTALDTQVTDSSGDFSFDASGLSNGTDYVVVETTPGVLTSTADSDGGNDDREG